MISQKRKIKMSVTEGQLRKKILDLVDDYAQLKFSKDSIVPNINSIPPAGKIIDKFEIQNMVSASLDGWLTTGRFNKLFELKLSKYLNVKHCLTVNSGSSANLIAFNALTSSLLEDKAIKKGDEVISVAACFPTTVNPIIQFGAIPVFVDIDIDTLNINSELIENAITSKTKAIMLAHTLGNPFNIEKIKQICEKYNLWLIEDTCDALGSTYKNQLVGTFGDIGTLSFYPAHQITMGEGGAVFTNNSKLKKIMESLRDWGRDCWCPPGCDNTCNTRFEKKYGNLPFGYDHKYVYSHLGYNLKITDIQAACGLAQLDKLNNFINLRRKNFNYLLNKMEVFSKYFQFAIPTKLSNPSWFGFPITIKNNNKINRLDLLNYLDFNKINSRLLFAGNIINQPYFKNINYRVSGDLEITNSVMNNTFWIGIYPALNSSHFDYIHQKFSTFLNNIN